MIAIGKPAPDFTATAVVGRGDFRPLTLSKDYRGKYVVLFFYPADFTYICPTEIREFSKRAGEFAELDCAILGISTDSKHSHKAWLEHELGELRHPLVADFTKEISRSYGALIEEEGVACRASFILDRDHVVHHASYNSDYLGRSVAELLRLVQALTTGERTPVEWLPGVPTLGK